MICTLFSEKKGQDESGIGFDLEDSVVMCVFGWNNVDFVVMQL